MPTSERIIEAGLEFIQQTNINLFTPQYAQVVIENNKRHLLLLTSESLNKADIEKIVPFQVFNFFALLDLKIDSIFPSTIGKSFKRKYENLPEQTDQEILIKNIFRLMKTIRNAFIHNLQDFDQTTENIHISYEFNRTAFELSLTKKGFICLNSLIFLYLSGKHGTGEYFLGLSRAIYSDLINELQNFTDEFPTPLIPLKESLKINYKIRDILINPEFTIQNQTIFFKNLNILNSEFIDLFIKVNEQIYLIPYEALTNNHSINFIEIQNKWLYNFSSPTHESVLFQ